MAFEVEQKFRDVDHGALRARLAGLCATQARIEEQEDTYFAHPARDFRESGEALRVRRIGSENRITYKGPKLPGLTKTREEIEIGFDRGAEACSGLSTLLAHLGFRPVAVVRKRREIHQVTTHGRALEVGLDLVESLGAFAEVEAIARGSDDVDEARIAVLAFAGRLGLEPSGVEPRSYLRMLLERGGGGIDPPADPA